MTKTICTYNDIVLPDLADKGCLRGENGACAIKVVVDDQHVRLFIGPRDWAWDRQTGTWIGSGTTLQSARAS
jgi:hypothetical protein